MKSPYDAAIRVCRQELGKIRMEVAKKTDEVEQLESAREAVDSEMRKEADLVRDEFFPFVNYGAYAQRKRVEAKVVDEARADARAQLDELVDRTQQAFGSYKSLDTAADRWHDGRARDASRREQNVMDEMASQAFHKARTA